jgi:uncharacterized membrane protein YukC
MAFRIHNLGKHKLAVDLRGGGVMYVQPNQISPPLREEMLYGNVHLAGWEAQGLVRRLDAKMAEVLEHEAKAAGRPVPETATKAKASSAKTDPEDDDDDGNEAGDEEEKVTKRPRKSTK